MLDELLIDVEGQRYVGHVWVAPGAALAPHAPQYWRFALHGAVVAEFPATTLDTPAAVRERFLTILGRVEALRTKQQH